MLKNFDFQPQVLSKGRTASFEGPHVLGPEPKVLQNRVRTIRQADRMAGSSVTFVQKLKESNKTSTKTTSSIKKNQFRTSVFERLGSPSNTTLQRTVSQDQSFHAGAGRGAHSRPFPGQRKKARTAASPSSARQHWQGPGKHCRGWGGHSFPSNTSAHPSVHQLPGQEQLPGSPEGRGCSAGQGGHIEGQQRDFSRVLQPAVPGSVKTGDLRPAIDLSTLNRHMVVPHFKMETQSPAQVTIRIQEWTVSIDIRDAYLHVPMHKVVRKFLYFVVNKRIYQFTCLLFGLATLPREFTKLLRPVVALLRRWGVRLHVYLYDRLIYADTPEQAQLHAQMTISVLQFLGWIINYEKSDLTPSQDFQFIGMQFNTRQFTVAPLCLKVQSVHHIHRETCRVGASTFVLFVIIEW